MNILDLIENLTEQYSRYGNVKVLLSSDEEGNSFTDSFIVQTNFAHDDGWEINVVHQNDIDDYEQDEIERVVVLWP